MTKSCHNIYPLQKHVYEFTKTAEEYDLRVSVTKTKILAF